MHTTPRFRVLAALVGSCLLGAAASHSTPAAHSAAATHGATQGYLSGPAKGDPLEIAESYLRSNRAALKLTESDLADRALSHRYMTKHNGVTHIYLHQRLAGIEVFNGLLNMNVDRDGRVINVGNRFVSDLAHAINTRSPELSAAQAVERAARHLGLSLQETLRVEKKTGGPAKQVLFGNAGVSLDSIPVKLMYLPVESGQVRLVWDLRIRPSGEHAWQMEVDAVTGEVLKVIDLVARDSYKVYAWPAESPNHVAAPLPFPPGEGRTIETQTAADPSASPFGWHDLNGLPGGDTINTTGNNVFAQTDLDMSDTFTPVVDTQPISPTRDFVFGLDHAVGPETYREAVVTNLFYWNNINHDIHHLYGFDEASGNFQINNYLRGGVGNDAVQADAQDGSGTNNANMLTLPEGVPPRMQMFVWTSPPVVTVNSPGAIAGDIAAAPAAFGAPLDATGVTGDVILVDDGVGTTSDGCEPIQNDLTDKVALIDRGTCEFGLKVKNAEDAGASAAIVVNNQGDGLVIMAPGATGGQVTIPSAFIGQSDGSSIKGELAGTVNVTLKKVGVDRDSDLDNGVIIHEYGHGVSNRLTGGPFMVTCLSNDQQGGEGWSDWWALALTQRAGADGTEPRGIGTYLSFQDPPGFGGGIRPFPYSTDMNVNPQTYGDLATGTLSVPHGVGTVWATTLWDMYWALANGVPELGLAGHGFRQNLYDLSAPLAGNQLALRLVMDGLKLQPCNPSFLEARDAILQADLASSGGANKCHIWWAFAKRGMGVNALDGGGGLNVTEGFGIPSECVAGPCTVPPTFGGAGGVASATDGNCSLTVSWSPATDNCGSAGVTYDVFKSTDASFTPDPGNQVASDLTGTAYSDSDVMSGVRYYYIVRATDGLGNTDSNLVRRSGTPVGSLRPGGTFFDDAGDTTSLQFSPGPTPDNTWTTRPSDGAVNATKVYATTGAGNYADRACMALESDTIYLGANPMLSFNSRYFIEPTWDGGILEIATAAGGFADWQKLDAINYPGVMGGPLGDPACSNPGLKDGEPAFTGASGDYLPFVGSLQAYERQAVRIRFLFSSDGGTNFDGWFLDNITIDHTEEASSCSNQSNLAPNAVDDSATTEQDTPVTIDVLSNDSDPDGDPLAVTSVTQPAHGTAANNGDGTVTYTPNTGFTGADSFTYTIGDGRGGASTATVRVTVNEDEGPACHEIDDSDPAVEYRHGWHDRTDAAASNGGYHRRMGSNKGGNSSSPIARVVFQGESITYFYAMSSIGGTADIYIDGVLRETLSYGAGPSGPENPTFGHSRTYAGLGTGTHELRVEHRTGAVYVDGFGFDCEPQAVVDPDGAEFHSATQTDTASVGEGPVIERAILIGESDVEVSVVVEGSSVPLTVRLIDPLGNVLAAGEALIGGLTASGLDAETPGTGTYKVQVVNAAGAFSTVQISIARTVRVRPQAVISPTPIRLGQ